jgi:uncharacterized protein (UPF0335 family)
MDDTMTDDATAAPRAGHNGFDRNQVDPYLRRLHALHDELESESGRIREDIKELYDEAEGALGAPKKAIRQVFAEQRARMKREDKWSEAEREALDQLKFSLGMLASTPLGEAALARAAAE